jgi:erythronate-4-phosphate dehydrogenase
MYLLADENMTGLEETFGRHCPLRRAPGRAMTRATLENAEVLLVRSVTRVDAQLLQGSDVRFVGSATIGTDHLDTTWLEQSGIRWAAAPGCNADAAAQYTLGMLLLAAQRLGFTLGEQRVAIVGHGNVGSRLHRLLDCLGVEVLVCDPPLAATGALRSVTLEEALEADVVSLHVPLTRDGPCPTWQMINHSTLSRMRPGALLINAARGDVVDGAALLHAQTTGHLSTALDVWPNEPAIDPALLAASTVASPHVAGYSVEGKLRGTQMIYADWLAWSGLAEDATELLLREHGNDRNTGVGFAPSDDTGAGEVAAVSTLKFPVEDPESLEALIIRATRVAGDDARMRAAKPSDPASFDPLRRAHAPRHEFSSLSVSGANPALHPRLRALGFKVDVASLSREV